VLRAFSIVSCGGSGELVMVWWVLTFNSVMDGSSYSLCVFVDVFQESELDVENVISERMIKCREFIST